MTQTVFPQLRTWRSALVIIIASLAGGMGAVNAQEAIPTCQPPNTGEYLLLVISPTADSQNQLRRALPANISPTICRYLSDTVTRIGGFTKIENANDWARYVKDIVGLSAFVTTRPFEPAAASTPSYNPQQLAAGYAVLVDYYNRPEVAAQVQQVVGGDVGLVSYGQRPYLLAVHTTNQREANSTLQALSDKGFFAMLVDSRKVMLLRSAVGF